MNKPNTEKCLNFKMDKKYPNIKIREVPYLIKEKRPLRNKPCPCGSGSKFKKCCGKTVIKQNIEPKYEKE